MKGEVVIQTRDLSRSFDGRPAVQRLSLEVLRGEIFGLVGPDGAGKTTTLRLLSGLLTPDSGSIRVAGFDIPGSLDRAREKMGYMAEGFGLYGDLKVRENLAFYADLYELPRRRRDQLIPVLLKTTRMEPFLERQARHLSGGMKQKLALMCALLHQPDVLLLDQPTSGVDPVSRRDFWKILQQLVAQGLTLVITTAYLDEAELCHRVGLLYRGELIRLDSPSALMEADKGRWFRLAGGDLKAARRHLSGLESVESAEISGARLHLLLSHSGSPTLLRRQLEEAGLPEAEIEPMRPSLEDIFIALVRRSSSEAP